MKVFMSREQFAIFIQSLSKHYGVSIERDSIRTFKIYIRGGKTFDVLLTERFSEDQLLLEYISVSEGTQSVKIIYDLDDDEFKMMYDDSKQTFISNYVPVKFLELWKVSNFNEYKDELFRYAKYLSNFNSSVTQVAST